jgi:hypothetical protein
MSEPDIIQGGTPFTDWSYSRFIDELKIFATRIEGLGFKYDAYRTTVIVQVFVYARLDDGRKESVEVVYDRGCEWITILRTGGLDTVTLACNGPGKYAVTFRMAITALDPGTEAQRSVIDE